MKLTTEQVQALLQNVLILLQKADYRATGAELMQIASTIQEFHQWARAYVAEQEGQLEDPSN